MKYQAYEEYKDSGVEWFGNIPSHWRVAGFKKYIQSIVDYRGRTPNKTDYGILLVTARNIKNGSLDYTLSQEFIAEEDYDDVMSRGKPKIGDVLFTTEAPLGEVSNVDKTNIALAQRVIKFSGKKDILDNYYFKYLIMSEEFQQSLYLFASGSTVKGIKAERFVYLRKILPSLIEQQKIANFLSHETAKIDTLIEKQQQLIKLLKEKRQAVISHAVTKGLNPNAPMRDSGVEWLGEVPEHWVNIKLKHITNKIIDTEHKTAEYFEDGKFLVCRTTNVRDGMLHLEGGKYTNLDIYNEWTRRGVPEIGDILFTREAPAGEACIVTAEVTLCLGQRMVLFKLKKDRIEAEFALHSIYSGLADDFVKQLSQGSTVVHFNMADIQNIPLFEPPLEEQNEIIVYLTKILSKYDGLIRSASGAINLMQERRTALISAAVTGKIDVRNWQSPNKDNKDIAA